MNEGMYEDIELRTADDVRDIVSGIIRKGVLSGDINPGEYMIVDDDGIMIGNESDFDADVLLYAIKIDDVVDFDNVSAEGDFVDLSGVGDSELFHNIF